MNPQPNFNRSLHAIRHPEFVCDICHRPGIKNVRTQKRHDGECAAIAKTRAKAKSKERIARDHRVRELRRVK